jgi:hypothetical protein
MVIREIELNLENEVDVQKKVTLPQLPALLPEIWSSPITHNMLYQQAQAVQHMLRSSVEPPDTPTRQNNRTNVQKLWNQS